MQVSDADLPFADSDSSGRSSVRALHTCENNSGTATPIAADFTTDLHPVSSPEPGFAESLVLEVSKRLQARMAEEPQDTRGQSPRTLPSEAKEAIASSNFTTYKTSVRVGENRHSSAVTEIRLDSRLQPLRTDQEKDVSSRENSAADGRTPMLSPKASDLGGGRLAVKKHLPRDSSPVSLHKAIWVETHLGEEVEEEREGSRGEGSIADSPPVRAVAVTVIPDDDSPAGSSAYSPSTSAGALPAIPTSSEASPGGSRSPPSPEGSDTGRRSKHRSSEGRVTRKTVNLPSKNKVFAHKVYVEPSSDGEEQSERLTSKASVTAEEAEL